MDFSFLVFVFLQRCCGPLCTKFSYSPELRNRVRWENKLGNNMDHDNAVKIPLICYSPFPSQIWPNALCVGSLMTKKTYIWPFKHQRHTGRPYDAEAIFNHQGHHNPM